MRSEGYGGRSVSLSECRRLFWLRGGPLAIPAGSELREPEKVLGDFSETTAFESDKLARSAGAGPIHQ